MPFCVITHRNGQDRQHFYKSKKQAENFFEKLKRKNEGKLSPYLDWITLVHSSHKLDEVLAHWEKPRIVL